MSFTESEPKVSRTSTVVSPLRWHSNQILLWSVRAGQFIFSIITLGLTSRVVDFGYRDSAAAYGVAVSVISTLYLILIVAIPLKLNDCVVAVFISELVMMILWFAAFVALAAQHGGIDCSTYKSYYITEDWSEPCRAAEAAIAMSFFAFLLYDFSSVLFWLNVMRPIRSATGGAWFYKHEGQTLSRWSNLGIRGNGPPSDTEAGPTVQQPVEPHANI